jgi:WD40 repeat protein
VVLIAVGTVRQAAGGGEQDTELVVDRTLFGPRLSVIPLEGVKIHEPSAPMIYCLSYPEQAAEFKLTVSEFYERERIFPLTEEPALRAMAQARMDVLVLRSDSIFVGRPLNPPSPAATKAEGASSTRNPANPVAVQVVRLLYGSGPAEGETVHVTDGNDPLPLGDAFIYFGHRTVADGQEQKGSRVQYSAYRRWPASEAARVEEALKRRSLFPIRESVDEYGYKERWREITFQGTRAETIGMLGSTFDAARTLAARRLISEGQSALAGVSAAIESNVFRTELIGSTSFTQQENLIRVLGIMEDHRADGEVVRLIEHILDKVRAGASFPLERPPQVDEHHIAHRYGQLSDYENHSLAWLLLTLDERDAARLFGERLTKLRDLSAYGWKDEIQHVVDRSHIEDHLELSALEPRVAQLTPVRWQAGFRSDGLMTRYAVAFSADDRFFAAAGPGIGKVWRTSDWALAAEFPQSGSNAQIAFSPDGQFLYVIGGGSREVFEKREWQTGKIVKRYAGHDWAVAAMQLTPDGKRVLSSADGYRNRSTILWDTETGKILDRNDNDSWARLVWHPGSGWFLGENRKTGWFRVDLETKQKRSLNLPLIDAIFSTDGTKIYCLERTDKGPGNPNQQEPLPNFQSASERMAALPKPILRCRDCRSENLTLQAERALDYPAERLRISGNGKQLVLTAADQVEVVSLPDLQSQVRSNLAIAAENEDRLRPRPVAISHDLRWLVAPRDSGTPELYEVRTGRRLPFSAAHSGPIVDVTFAADDTRLRTEAEDGVICLWDPVTTELIERTGEPVTSNKEPWRPDTAMVHLSEDRRVKYFFNEASRNGRYGPPTSYTIQVAPPGKSETSEDDEDDESVPTDDDDSPPTKDGRRKLGTVELKWGQYTPVGLVPDGKHLFIGTHVCRRDDLTLVSAVNVAGKVARVSFSADGSRYALVTSHRMARPTIFAGVRQYEPDYYHEFRVHEARTGQTLLAVKVPAPGVGCIALSRDGRSAACVGRDSSIQVWPVPDPLNGRMRP